MADQDVTQGGNRFLRPVGDTGHFQVFINGRQVGSVFCDSSGRGYWPARLNGTRITPHRFFPTPRQASIAGWLP